MTPDAALRGAYCRTLYAVPGVAVRVGRRSAAADRLLLRLRSRTGAFVTAWNPRGRRSPLGRNRRMQAALLAHARRLPRVEGRGTALRGRWFEEHALIAADPRPLLVLARRFRQRAVVVVRRGAPARLAFVPPRATAGLPASG